MYKYVISSVSVTFYHETAFSESKGRATVTMNHTRETGTRLRVDWIKILALDGTERTKQTKYKIPSSYAQ